MFSKFKCCLLIVSGSLATLGSSSRTFAGDIQIPIHFSDQETAYATLRLPPKHADKKRLPVVLIFGGFESAGRVLDLIHSDETLAVASFDYPFKAPRRFQFPESLHAIPEVKALFPKTARGISELVHHLKNQPEIDPNQIFIVGASFGTPFALAAAAQDPSIRGLVLIHGFGSASTTLNTVILRSWLPKYGWIARPVAWLVSRLGWAYLDIPAPEQFAKTLKSNQSVLMITASRDSFIPQEASDSLWRALQLSQAHSVRTLQNTDHLMPGSDALIEQLVHEVLNWINKSANINYT